NAEWEAGLAGTKALIGLDLVSLARLGVAPSQSLAEALTVLREAQDIRERQLRREPGDHQTTQSLANALFTLAQVLRARGDKTGARAADLRARQVWIDLYTYHIKREPDNLTWPRGLAKAYRDLALARSSLGESAAALEAHRKSQEGYEKLTK